MPVNNSFAVEVQTNTFLTDSITGARAMTVSHFKRSGWKHKNPSWIFKSSSLS